MRTTALFAALVIAGCTNETPAQTAPASADLSRGLRCPGDFDDVDAVIGRAAALRRKQPAKPAGDIDALNAELGRLHHRVDIDMENVAAARERWEAAKRTLAADAVALDQAISDFEDVGLPPAEPW